MRVGQYVLDATLARTTAEQAAVTERLECGVGLIVAAGGVAGVQEVLDPPLHMREEHVGADASKPEADDGTGHQEKVQPIDVELDKEHRGDHRQHADIRLRFQQQRDHQEGADGQRLAGEARRTATLADQPCDDDGEAGF